MSDHNVPVDIHEKGKNDKYEYKYPYRPPVLSCTSVMFTAL